MEIKRCYDTIIGASVAENQLVQSGATSVTVQSGHKYYAKIDGTESLGTSTGSAITINDSAKDMVIDLSIYLPANIVDYIYSLESATAGAGIAKLREWGFLRGYQAYNSGSLESVEVTGKVVRGFNQFDKSTLTEHSIINADGTITTYSALDSIVSDFIKVIPNAEYYFKDVWNTSQRRTLAWYDADKNFINAVGIYASSGNLVSGAKTAPANAFYVRISTATDGTDTCCVSISNPDRNGEYEPYTEQSYDYGDDTLRGIFKLDANNQLYADGDVKTSDGTITRYYGTRAYQSGDESLADAITDGTTTVYKLTTPTTEQGDPFPSPQVCYPDGTEEYVTSNGVPVGHETRYEL